MMQLDSRELHLLFECVNTRIDIYHQLIGQEKCRPRDQQGLLLGLEAQVDELRNLARRLAQAIAVELR